MNAATELLTIDGPAGPIDVAFDPPQGPARAAAVIAHPHPLYGGTRDNKVVQTIARGLLARGVACWRPNFRGVGGSAGAHDEGRGETDDLIAVVEAALAHGSVAALASPPLLLAGFSFGAFVQARVAERLAARGRAPARMLLVAPAVSRFEVGRVPPGTLVIHGDEDDVVPMSAVLAWAKPQQLPVMVLPGNGHFFHGCLPVLRRIVQDAATVALAGPAGAGAD